MLVQEKTPSPFQTFNGLLHKIKHHIPYLSNESKSRMQDSIKQSHRYFKGDVVTYTKYKKSHEVTIVSYNPKEYTLENRIIISHPVEGLIGALNHELSPPLHGSKEIRDHLYLLETDPALLLHELMDSYIWYFPNFNKHSSIPYKHLSSYTSFPYHSSIKVKHIIPLNSNNVLSAHLEPYNQISKKEFQESLGMRDLDLYLIDETTTPSLKPKRNETSQPNLFSKALNSNGFLYFGYSLVYSPYSITPEIIYYAYIEICSEFGIFLMRETIELSEEEYQLGLKL